MSNTLLIMKREYLERVKTKAFIFMTLLVPGVMALSFGAAYLTAQHAGQDQHIAIASNDAALALAVRDQLGDSKTAPIHADVIAPADESQQNALIQRVNDKQLDGYLWLGVKTGQATEVQYDTHASPDLFVSSRIQDAVDNAQVRMKLEDKGFQKADVDLLMKQVTVTTAQVKDGKVVTSDAGKSFWVGYLMMFLLYFSVTYFSMNVARSVIQEKTSRIFEVMLATVKPSDMMAGKMLGVGAAGLTQILIWVVLAVAVSMGTLLTHGAAGQIHLGGSWLQMASFCVYFLLGFTLYSAIAAAAGACFNAEAEVQQMSIAIVLPMLVAMLSFGYIESSPNAAYSVFLSIFPLTSPLAMFLRMLAQTPPLWQILLSVTVLLLTIYGTVWIAARIYRVGILMYGKRPTLPELLRWLRYA
jgi:ABC-2 type transport system permease protein